MKETNDFMKSISLNTILYWIKKEKNPVKKKAFEIIKALKLDYSKKDMDEVLRVIDDSSLLFEGFLKYNKTTHSKLESSTIALTRAFAEYDNDYRQLVCNSILEVKDSNGKKMFGFLKRSSTYKENRLSDLVGMVGGHANTNDGNLFACLVRELSEEIKNISFEDSKIEPLGYIRLNNGTVSNQHLCVLYVTHLSGDVIALKSNEENEKLIWLNEDQIRVALTENKRDGHMASLLDSWAKIAMENYLNIKNE